MHNHINQSLGGGFNLSSKNIRQIYEILPEGGWKFHVQKSLQAPNLWKSW